MRILSVDTSTMMSSISILEDNRIIGDYSVNQDQTHSEKLVLNIKRLLEDVKLTVNDIDLFAVAKGPGSFTGLRIGMTSIKAIAQALDKDIIGISTLEAMAFSVLKEGYIFPVIDARGKRYFSGLYRREDGELEKIFEEILHEDEIYELVKGLDKYIFVGDSASLLPDKIKNLPNVEIAPANLNNAIGKNLCVLAKRKYEDGKSTSLFELEPNYLRKSQAEINQGK